MDFARSAPLYDAVYAARGKDYAGEARRLLQLIEPAHHRRPAILDVGCGTGEHLRFLAEPAKAIGLDVDPAMLAVARAKLPRTSLVRADMRRFALRPAFDAVTCLFASVGYLPDAESVAGAIAAMAACLAPRGRLLLEPPLGPDQLEPPRPSSLSFEHEGRRVERATSARHEPGRLRIRFDFTVHGPEGTTRFSETHSILTLPPDVYARAFASAGLDLERDEGWTSLGGLLIGRRP
jgi:SAM-dependent methyltransferase